jgi:hypothetical protein
MGAEWQTNQPGSGTDPGKGFSCRAASEALGRRGKRQAAFAAGRAVNVF